MFAIRDTNKRNIVGFQPCLLDSIRDHDRCPSAFISQLVKIMLAIAMLRPVAFNDKRDIWNIYINAKRTSCFWVNKIWKAVFCKKLFSRKMLANDCRNGSLEFTSRNGNVSVSQNLRINNSIFSKGLTGNANLSAHCLKSKENTFLPIGAFYGIICQKIKFLGRAPSLSKCFTTPSAKTGDVFFRHFIFKFKLFVAMFAEQYCHFLSESPLYHNIGRKVKCKGLKNNGIRWAISSQASGKPVEGSTSNAHSPNVKPRAMKRHERGECLPKH